MAFTDFDPTKPPGSTGTGTTAIADILNNFGALRVHSIAGGLFPGYVYSQTVGTGSTYAPQFMYFTKGATIIRVTTTYVTIGGVSNYPSVMVVAISTDNGANYDTVQTITNTYTGELVTSTTGGGGLVTKILNLLGIVTRIDGQLAAHAAAVGAAAHGLGNMSTQAKSAVDITGGNFVVTDGSATKLTAGTFRDKANTSTAGTGTVVLDGDAYGYYGITQTGNITIDLAMTLAANTGGGILLALTTSGNGAHTVTLPSILWVGGTAPTISASPVKSHVFQFYKISTIWFGNYIGAL